MKDRFGCSNVGAAGTLSWLGFWLLLGASTAMGQASSGPDFNREIRPILAKHCFTCHGPDEETRAADLRLDHETDAKRDLGGYRAIASGDSAASELIARVEHSDPDMRMPPGEKAVPLNATEIALLKQWIDAGATYADHWAFLPPQRPAIPQTQSDLWSRDAVDALAHRGMSSRQLSPNPEADRLTLVRRLYLDLIGIPPTPEQADKFVNDPSPLAYTRLVDTLLADPGYGQRFARPWLDMARYADTNGYEKDRPRSIWPYRDWVISALNADKPFDTFSIEQIAGDMLPEATLEQKIATGFQRNTMLNEEGGIDPLEFRFLAMVDRVNTLGTVWLGLSVGCAQCHTHKYDPITHEDYYALMALIDNADEPDLAILDAEHQRAQEVQQTRLEQLQQKLIQDDVLFSDWLDALRTDSPSWDVAKPVEMQSTLPKLRLLSDGSIYADGDATKRDEYRITYEVDQPVTAIQLEALADERLPGGGPGRSYYEGRKGDFFLSELQLLVNGVPIKLQDASHSHGSLSVGSGTTAAANVIDGDGSTGWSTSERPGESHRWVANLSQPIQGKAKLEVYLLFERHFAASLGRFKISFANHPQPVQAGSVPQELVQAWQTQTDTNSPELLNALATYYLESSPKDSDNYRQWLEALRSKVDAPTTMVMREREPDNPRITQLRHRGEYLQPRQAIGGTIPEFFRQASGAQQTEASHADLPSNRLQLAKWLVSEGNPLVSRVAVNRAWQEFFGQGLVRTSGDYGTQSAPPIYPDIIDTLAVDFQEQGWSLKRLHRRLVHTAIYRQSAVVDQTKYMVDPENHWLARGPRFRLTAEAIRDSLLAASGLLVEKLGGPSVYPPQDPTVTAIGYGSPAWNVSPGEDAYRRSLYTYTKRTTPFAAYLVFDGPTGENCIDRRDRSNTPLQALTLLNDPMYVEMAKALATYVLQKKKHTAAIINTMFRRLLSRQPQEAERVAIEAFVLKQESRARAGEIDADAVTRWAWVARSLMNLDETITKE
jgi:hypothetical protein